MVVLALGVIQGGDGGVVLGGEPIEHRLQGRRLGVEVANEAQIRALAQAVLEPSDSAAPFTAPFGVPFGALVWVKRSSAMYSV